MPPKLVAKRPTLSTIRELSEGSSATSEMKDPNAEPSLLDLGSRSTFPATAAENAQKAAAQDKAFKERELLKSAVDYDRRNQMLFSFPYFWALPKGVPMWTPPRNMNVPVAGTPEVRRFSLLEALESDKINEWYLVQEEQRYTSVMVAKEYYHARSAALEAHDEVREFRSASTGLPGLVIHSRDPNHKHDQPTSSAMFVGRYAESLEHSGGAALTYVAARREFPSAYTLIQALCRQLLNEYFQELELPFVSPIYLKALSEGGTSSHCALFRDLLCEIAAWIARNEKGKRRHTVVIDGLNILERDWYEFLSVVDCFRILSDEAQFGELGDHILFKYALIHPTTCHMLYDRPYGSEMHVWMTPPP